MLRRLIPLLSLALACATDEGVPDGKLARVGEVVLGPEDLAGVQAQLGAYAQLRFRGEEGRTSLLEALVTAELLAQEAIAAGLGEDPRVHWAVLEEVATLERNAELERRVPYAELAADRAALRAHYDAHPEDFASPERRSVEGVLFVVWGEAEGALAQLQAGTTELAALGEIVTTPLQSRDDAEYPAFHRVLFDAALRDGDTLAQPVMVGERVLVGRVREVVPAARAPFDDPVVQERLVQAVRAPRLERAERELAAELAARWPEERP